MSKRRRLKNDRWKRDIKPITNPPRIRLLPRPQLSVLPAIEDRRRLPSFPITKTHTYHRTSGVPVTPVFRLPRYSLAKTLRLDPVLPPNAIVCVRRKIRREVLLALGLGPKRRKYRTSETSKIHCR